MIAERSEPGYRENFGSTPQSIEEGLAELYARNASNQPKENFLLWGVILLLAFISVALFIVYFDP